MPKPRLRSRSLDELVVRDDLASPSGVQRVTTWMVPAVVDLCLLYGSPALQLSYHEGSEYHRDATRARSALDRLRRLDGASDLRVRAFVMEFGSLFRPDDAMGVGYPNVYFRLEGGREAIDSYREVAKVLAATMRLVSLIRRKRSVAVSDLRVVRDWLAVNSLGADYTVKTAEATSTRLLGNAGGSRVMFDDSLRDVPAGVVNRWLQAQAVRPFLTWRNAERPEVRWTAGLWGLIGAQLMFAVRAGERVTACDGCGAEVQHKRQPKAGQMSWCTSSECTRLRNREAKRQSRLRSSKRSARRGS
jgi:hypothetical protein